MDQFLEDTLFTIYMLIDPRDQSVRYVGITSDVYHRMINHMRCIGTNAEKIEWIRELQQEQIMFIMHSIEKVQTVEQALEREDYWIQYYLQHGARLTNIEGVPTQDKKRRTIKKRKSIILSEEQTMQWRQARILYSASDPLC